MCSSFAHSFSSRITSAALEGAALAKSTRLRGDSQ
jgi:hypothetical protein